MVENNKGILDLYTENKTKQILKTWSTCLFDLLQGSAFINNPALDKLGEISILVQKYVNAM